jgi:glutathione-regulated potassium-efflux system ancillary protein KefF
MIRILYAHPYPRRSRANRVLLDAVRSLPSVQVCSLYDRYPDFSIDVESEQQALLQAETIVWQHPLYWYSVPPLLKLWFDKVLAYGFAYGDGAAVLRGKRCQWVVTSGGDDAAFADGGIHGHPFERFVAPIEQTARFCQMEWLPPLIVHGARRIDDASLLRASQTYRDRLTALAAEPLAAEPSAAAPAPEQS